MMPTDNVTLPILYQDKHLVAIHKPPGLLVHRSWVDSRETLFALQLVRDQIGQHVYPVHRLDKPTSGVLLFALSPEVAAGMTALFIAGGLAKEYLAVVRGVMPEKGMIDKPLSEIRDKKDPCPGGEDEAPASARTCYIRLASIELPFAVDKYPHSRYSLVALQPGSGRRHQLRRHLKSVSHPIIGDSCYGKSAHNRFFARQFGCFRLLLAATELQFVHPVTGLRLCIRAELEGAFLKVIREFGWEKWL